jgi:hypothetical protein
MRLKMKILTPMMKMMVMKMAQKPQPFLLKH